MRKTLFFNGELTEGKHFDLFVNDGERVKYVATEVERALMPYKLKKVRVSVTIEVEETVEVE